MIARLGFWAYSFASCMLFVLLVVMVALVFCQVALRYVFGYSIVWTEEVARYAFVWATFIGASLALRVGAHIGVRLLIDKLPRRWRRVFEIAANALVLVFICISLYVGTQATLRAWKQQTAILQMPMAIPYLAIPIGFFLMAIQQIEALFRFLKGEVAQSVDAKEPGRTPVRGE